MPTTINDLVSVQIENKPAFFARIEDISPDVKPGWWRVKLLVLTNPVQIFTWILQEDQINGTPFTMGGTPVCLVKILSPAGGDSLGDAAEKERDGSAGRKETAKVVSLSERKKEK